MTEKIFELNDQTLSLIEEIGGHMPGGFFIYKADEPEDLIYANKAVFDIYGCKDINEFISLTGYTFKGMVHPDDYSKISGSIIRQINTSRTKMDHAEYRIIRADGQIRWVDDYGHYANTKEYGGVYTVFISDITEKHDQLETDSAVKDAVIHTLTNAYNTVWLINDETGESCSLYHSDMDPIHSKIIERALGYKNYTDIKNCYVNEAAADEDKERLRRQGELAHIHEQLKTKDHYSISYIREFDTGSRYYRADIGKVHMPGGKLGVMMGFYDVDDETRRQIATQKALDDARKAEEENRRRIDEVLSAAKLADLMGSASSLLTNTPAMSFSKDAETGMYLACNQAFAEYAHKKDPGEVTGLTDKEIFDPETAAHFIEDDKKTLSMDSPYIFFEDVPDAKGNIRNLQTTKTKFTDPSGRLCLLGICVDVTELTRIKAAEAESMAKQHELEERISLQEQLLVQEKHRQELDSMITALASDYRSVYHVDLDANNGVCYRADPDDNEQTAEGVHFPYLERFQWYADTVVDEKYREGFLKFIEPDNIREALSESSIIAYRYLAHRGGREYYEMIRMAGVRHPQGRNDHIVHAVGLGLTIIDNEMRETLAMNNTLKEALDAAEEASRAKTAFLSNMSHEIRTPMNAIIGLDTLALRDSSLPKETVGYLEKIGGSARHLLGLINDILDMSRIESGRMFIRREEFSFRDMLDQINTMVMSQCAEKGLKYECTLVGGISDYYIGDDMKLKQVLINILSNAIKFTETPGNIKMTIERAAVYEDQSTLKFIIKDTGVGIDKAFIPKIFDSFTQEYSDRNNKYGSTGLGMAITKSIVTLMNGTISVKSEKGKGSEFTVMLTLKNSEHNGHTSTRMDPKSMHILIVDDEDIAAEHARTVLDEAGIKADCCSGGEEALHMLEVQYVKHEPYNLILLDWKMPEMDGIEVTKRIRDKYDNETTVIILTSFNWDEIIDEATSAGVDGFLAKPLFASTVIGEFERIARKNKMKLFKEKKRASLKGRRILLAEDIMINAEIMKELIKLKDAEADHAENGEAALEMFASSSIGYYDTVLMDVRMPKMDGLEAAAAIRALPREDAKTVPIIAMTANAFDEDVQRSLQVGMNAHLSKPVEPERLYRTIEELIWESTHKNTKEASSNE